MTYGRSGRVLTGCFPLSWLPNWLWSVGVDPYLPCLQYGWEVRSLGCNANQKATLTFDIFKMSPISWNFSLLFTKTILETFLTKHSPLSKNYQFELVSNNLVKWILGIKITNLILFQVHYKFKHFEFYYWKFNWISK